MRRYRRLVALVILPLMLGGMTGQLLSGPNDEVCETHHGTITVEVCVPKRSPNGAPMVAMWEDGSAVYEDDQAWDPEDQAFKPWTPIVIQD